jgi:hypothetical protein
MLDLRVSNGPLSRATSTVSPLAETHVRVVVNINFFVEVVHRIPRLNSATFLGATDKLRRMPRRSQLGEWVGSKGLP